jgi:tetratricopeptide (TPR) repeat protein
MDKRKLSAATTRSGGAAKAEQISAYSKDTVGRGRFNIQVVQNVLLIWLDNNMDDNSNDYCNTISQLRRAVSTINTFTNGEECIQFLEDLHNMSQVDWIFIFCGNKKYHEQWVKQWPKIKGVFTEISQICEALKQTAQQCEQDGISMSFMVSGGDVSNKKLDQLDPSFMYTTIMKEILLIIKFEEQHFMEFIQYCREALVGNEGELKNIKKLERKYRDETAIWWYTYDCFLYPMLNRALRVMDVDIIIKMGFFIGDLHRHIEQLHKEQFGGHKFNKSFAVYRGQGMSKADFEQLTKTKGGLMSFNTFLSTSKNREVSLDFARRAMPNQDMVGILFVMGIDPSKSTTPFASINDVSYFKKEEEEVLFAMHTTFRVGDITPMGENHQLFRVELMLTSDNDQDLRRLTDRIREETFPNSRGWYRLGSVLLKVGQFDKAQQVYGILLEHATEESGKAPIYHQLGLIKYNQGEYQEAIKFYQKALEIKKEMFSPNHPNLANTIIALGNVYYSMGEYSKALSSQEKALEISQKSLPPNHPDLADSYNNIGSLHGQMGKYLKALPYFEKALKIRQQSLPSNHPDLAVSYNNIGNVYYKKGNYSKALSYYEKALAIKQQSLPPTHPDLGASYNNIGSVYENMGNYSKACSFYERAVEIGQHSLPSNHPHLQIYRKNLEDVKKKF